MTEAAAKAASDAAEDLTAAEEIQASFQGLLAEDSPVKADLVRGNPEGLISGMVMTVATTARRSWMRSSV